MVGHFEGPPTRRLLTSRLLANAGFLHAFPERAATLDELVRALETDGPIAQIKQVHGGEVVELSGVESADGSADGRVDGSAEGRVGDALVGRAGPRPVAVGMRVADCVPILVADEASGDVAAIHAGWRGVTRRVVPAAIARLGAGGRLVAAIGPCIGGCCFEVGRDVAGAIARASGMAFEALVVSDRGEKVDVDLRAAVRSQLVAAGLASDRVEDVPGCTKHETARFHSFRRDGAESGRMLAAIATRPTANPAGSMGAPRRERLSS